MVVRVLLILVALFCFALDKKCNGFTSSNKISVHHHHEQQQQQQQQQGDHSSRTQVIGLLSSSESSSSSSSSEIAIRRNNVLSPLELFCISNVEQWYSKAFTIKCPFWKRRSVDILDGIDMVMRFLIIRHKSLDIVDDIDKIIGPPPSHATSNSIQQSPKLINLPLWELQNILQKDWCYYDDNDNNNHKRSKNKGYYITGRLNSTIYRNDCIFDGPDPDMPVRGLRKYVNAASQLFDREQSSAQLLSLEIINQNDDKNKNNNNYSNITIVATWCMNGVLRLPWKPILPQWTGSTIYYFDDQGLIYKHEEYWDVSAIQAFLETFVPQIAQFIY